MMVAGIFSMLKESYLPVVKESYLIIFFIILLVKFCVIFYPVSTDFDPRVKQKLSFK